MLAAMTIPTATESERLQSIQHHLARHTPFFIRDILGKENNESDNVETDLEATQNPDCPLSPSCSCSVGSGDESLSSSHQLMLVNGVTEPKETMPRELSYASNPGTAVKTCNKSALTKKADASQTRNGGFSKAAKDIDRYSQRRHRLHSREDISHFQPREVGFDCCDPVNAGENPIRYNVAAVVRKHRKECNVVAGAPFSDDVLLAEREKVFVPDGMESKAKLDFSHSVAHDYFRNSLLKQLEEGALCQRSFAGGLVVNPMLDLQYAYALGACGAIPLHTLPQQLLLSYSNFGVPSANFDSSLAEYIDRARQLAAQSVAPIHHNAFQRYILNDWPQDKISFNPRSCGSQQSARDSGGEEACSDLDQNSSERCSDYPPSPQSPCSLTSPRSPPKTAVQLPAYLRNKLSGCPSSSDSGSASGNGKPKKCRRSRTVFTEFQVICF